MAREWKPVRKDGKRECPECTNSFRHDRTFTHATVAHFDYSVTPRRWCPGGAPPTDPTRRSGVKSAVPRKPR